MSSHPPKNTCCHSQVIEIITELCSKVETERLRMETMVSFFLVHVIAEYKASTHVLPALLQTHIHIMQGTNFKGGRGLPVATCTVITDPPHVFCLIYIIYNIQVILPFSFSSDGHTSPARQRLQSGHPLHGGLSTTDLSWLSHLLLLVNCHAST